MNYESGKQHKNSHKDNTHKTNNRFRRAAKAALFYYTNSETLYAATE